MKKNIDMKSWARSAQYKLFKEMDYPHFNVCANVDITKMYAYIKEKKLSFFRSMVYFASKAANNIPEFRYRIQGDQVVEYDLTHPSFTVLSQPEVFSYCHVDYQEDFISFYNNAEEKMQSLAGKVDIEDPLDKDDLIYITSLPWISFTSVTHPILLSSTDSIPRLGWGKYFEENGRLKLPFSVQVNHALMDGLHVGKYYTLLQEMLDAPEQHLLSR